MIVSVEDLIQYPAFRGLDEDILKEQLDAVEILVRKYTNNNFQNRNIRFIGSSEGKVLNGVSPFLKVGDTVQISESGVNDGLYIVTALDDSTTTVDKNLYTVESNMVTKIEYPPAVRMGVINLMTWEVEHRSKIGIKSETLSRHSVTYFDLDANNQVMGYPVSLLGFLDLYKKARF